MSTSEESETSDTSEDNFNLFEVEGWEFPHHPRFHLGFRMFNPSGVASPLMANGLQLSPTSHCVELMPDDLWGIEEDVLRGR